MGTECEPLLLHHEKLLHAAECGDVHLFKQYLLDNSAARIKPDWGSITHTKSGNSVMHVACRSGATEILEFLKSNEDIYGQANFELMNLEGKRPIHEAAQAGQLACLKFLLHLGVTVDPLKRADWTPLMLACTKRDATIVKTLIDAGANLHLQNKDGWTAFHIASREGCIDIIQLLLDCDSLLWKTISKNGRTPLHTAALHGHINVVELLLSRGGYKKDDKDSCGSTPLMDAARAGYPQIMDILIVKQGADLNETDLLGRNCLHLAAQAGMCSSIRYLVEQKGMDVNAKTRLSHTALHFAAKENQEKAIRLLLELGADPLVEDYKKRTPADVAKEAKHVNCAKILSRNNDDP